MVGFWPEPSLPLSSRLSLRRSSPRCSPSSSHTTLPSLIAILMSSRPVLPSVPARKASSGPTLCSFSIFFSRLMCIRSSSHTDLPSVPAGKGPLVRRGSATVLSEVGCHERRKKCHSSNLSLSDAAVPSAAQLRHMQLCHSCLQARPAVGRGFQGPLSGAAVPSAALRHRLQCCHQFPQAEPEVSNVQPNEISGSTSSHAVPPSMPAGKALSEPWL